MPIWRKRNFANKPIVLFPVIGRIFPYKFHHAISQLIRFQQQQLNDVKAYLCFAALLCAQCQTECQPIKCEHIVVPNERVDGVDTFFNVMILSGRGHLKHQVIDQLPQMSRQSTGTDSFQHSMQKVCESWKWLRNWNWKQCQKGFCSLVCNRIDVIRFQHHLE